MKKAIIAITSMVICSSYGIEITPAQHQVIIGAVIGGNPIARHCYVVDNNDPIVGAYSKNELQKLRADNSLIKEAVKSNSAVIIKPGTQFCTINDNDGSDGMIQIELIQSNIIVWVAN